MANMTAAVLDLELEERVKHLVTEDDEPVDNLFSAKQQRMLVEPLYSSWIPPVEENSDEHRTFLADANVGVFYSYDRPPLVPDVFLSLDVDPGKDWHAQTTRSYFVWRFGKLPDVVVEIVSNKEGNELGSKLRDYARIGVKYYVVFDPFRELSQDVLRVYEPGFAGRYRLRGDYDLPNIGLSLMLWEGVFEGLGDSWLRWCHADGNMISTGQERANLEAARADQEAKARQKAEDEVAQLRAELERLRQQ